MIKLSIESYNVMRTVYRGTTLTGHVSDADSLQDAVDQSALLARQDPEECVTCLAGEGRWRVYGSQQLLDLDGDDMQWFATIQTFEVPA